MECQPVDQGVGHAFVVLDAFVERDHAEARRRALRQAIALPGADNRVMQNLVVVLGVQGKFDEAEKIAGAEIPKALMDSNREYFRAMLNPSRSWETLRGTQN